MLICTLKHSIREKLLAVACWSRAEVKLKTEEKENGKKRREEALEFCFLWCARLELYRKKLFFPCAESVLVEKRVCSNKTTAGKKERNLFNKR